MEKIEYPRSVGQLQRLQHSGNESIRRRKRESIKDIFETIAENFRPKKNDTSKNITVPVSHRMPSRINAKEENKTK